MDDLRCRYAGPAAGDLLCLCEYCDSATPFLKGREEWRKKEERVTDMAPFLVGLVQREAETI